MVRFWVYSQGRTDRICGLIALRSEGRQVKNRGKVAGFSPKGTKAKLPVAEMGQARRGAALVRKASQQCLLN